MTKNNHNKVTIVVPVYGDWPSLKQCINSLKENVSNRHEIILVNDCGPDVDILEKNILKSIKGLDNYTYYRNDTNLGFVGTCNRAVNELDMTTNDILLLNSDTVTTNGFLEEMLRVLYITDKHGCVCPRSNNATIASIPFKFRNQDQYDREIDYTKKVYNHIKDMLPDFSTVPVAVGFCMLIKRDLITNVGLFDPTYGLGYNEENDFCMRINQYGYSCVMAHKAMVYHLESKSFTSEKKQLLDAKNREILLSRYPYYDTVVQRYLKYEIDPVDWFADVIATNPDEKRKVMIDLFHLPLAMNGTARNSLSFVETIKNHPLVISGLIEPVIVTSKEGAKFHNLSKFNIRIVQPHQLNELFHLAICPLQIFHSDNLQLLNRWSLKVVFAHLDIIAIRSNYLLNQTPINKTIFEDAFRLADRAISISEYTKEDTLSYYYNIDKELREKITVIPQGYPDTDFAISDEDIDHSKDNVISNFIKKGKYVLVFGNEFKHKFIKETVEKLATQKKLRIIILGPRKLSIVSEDILLVESGGLSDDTLRGLYRKCEYVIFPSVYEGFGLPIAEAAKFGKSILVANYALNKEVAKLYEKFNTVYFFDNVSELLNLVENDEIKRSKSQTINNEQEDFRTLTDYNYDLLKSALNILDQPVNPDILRDRWNYFMKIDQYMLSTGNRTVKRSTIEKTANYLKSRNRKLYLASRSIYRSTIKNK